MPKGKPIKKKPREGFGVTGLVLGVLSLIFIWILPPIGIIFGLFGIIFGAVQQAKAPTDLGKAARIISIIGLILSIVISVVYLTAFFAIREFVMAKLSELQSTFGTNPLNELHNLTQYKDLLDQIPQNLTH